VVLMNDDMQVLTADWLAALMDHLRDPAVGAVGAKLITGEAQIQHAGVLLGVNQTTAHAFYGLPADTIGYNGFTHVSRNYLAVTGACLATRRDVIDRVGGFDPQFAIDYNDIDYCLSAVRAGYRIVYTPHAQLIH